MIKVIANFGTKDFDFHDKELHQQELYNKQRTQFSGKKRKKENSVEIVNQGGVEERAPVEGVQSQGSKLE